MDIEAETVRLLVSTLIPLAVGYMAAWIRDKLKEQKQSQEEYAAIKAGVQALLRDRMIALHSHYEEKGWAPIYARENFIDMYVSYKNLNGNGVIEDIYQQFLTLPTEERHERYSSEH